MAGLDDCCKAPKQITLKDILENTQRMAEDAVRLADMAHEKLTGPQPTDPTPQCPPPSGMREALFALESRVGYVAKALTEINLVINGLATPPPQVTGCGNSCR